MPLPLTSASFCAVVLHLCYVFSTPNFANIEGVHPESQSSAVHEGE